MKKWLFYIDLSLKGKRNSGLHFVKLYTLGLLVFFITQLLTGWVVTTSEQTIQDDVVVNRTITWKFIESVNEKLITQAEVEKEIENIQEDSRIERLILDEASQGIIQIVVKDYDQLIPVAEMIGYKPFGSSSINGQYTVNLNALKSIQLFTMIINRMTQLIALISFIIVVSKYLDKRKNEIKRLWYLGYSNRLNKTLTFISQLSFVLVGIFISFVVSVFVISIIAVVIYGSQFTVYTIILKTMTEFSKLLRYVLVYMLISVLLIERKTHQILYGK